MRQLIKSSRQAPPGLKVRRNAHENFFSHPREQHDCGCGDGPACARHLQHHWRRHRRENTQTSVQELPEGVQRRHAEDQCSVQPQHRDRNPAGLTQQTVQSMTMWTYSQDRPDRRHEQVEEGCRSTALYSSSPRNRRTSSSVCKAGALVSPSSCLDGEPHGWVPVDTHSTPVPSMTGEAVGGLCSIRAQSTTGKCATRTW